MTCTCPPLHVCLRHVCRPPPFRDLAAGSQWSPTTSASRSTSWAAPSTAPPTPACVPAPQARRGRAEPLPSANGHSPRQHRPRWPGPTGQRLAFQETARSSSFPAAAAASVRWAPAVPINACELPGPGPLPLAGAPQNHWFGPAGDPRAAGIGTPEAIKLVWSTHRQGLRAPRRRRRAAGCCGVPDCRAPAQLVRPARRLAPAHSRLPLAASPVKHCACVAAGVRPCWHGPLFASPKVFTGLCTSELGLSALRVPSCPALCAGRLSRTMGLSHTASRWSRAEPRLDAAATWLLL